MLLGAILLTLLILNLSFNGPLIPWDKSISQALHNQAVHDPRYVVLAMMALSASGREGIMAVSLILAIIWVRRKNWRGVAMVFFGIVGGEGLFQLLSNLVNRHRPVWPDPLEVLPGPGFPSGHSTTSILLAFMIVYLLWPRIKSPGKKALVVLLAALWVFLVGLARTYMGMHYPTDILAGWSTGIFWAGLVYTTIDVLYFRARRIVSLPK